MVSSRPVQLAMQTTWAFNAGDIDGALTGAAEGITFIDYGLGVTRVGIDAVRTHKAGFRLAFPDVELSEVRVEELLTLDSVGRIVLVESYWNQLSLLEQLGVVALEQHEGAAAAC